MDPFKTTDNLLRFLDLPPNKLIETFIEEHTMITRNSDSLVNSTNFNPRQIKTDWSMMTIRNSKKTVFKWKLQMKKEDILNVQRYCESPMRLLGYNLIHNVTLNREHDDIPLITKSAEELWSH